MTKTKALAEAQKYFGSVVNVGKGFGFGDKTGTVYRAPTCKIALLMRARLVATHALVLLGWDEDSASDAANSLAGPARTILNDALAGKHLAGHSITIGVPQWLAPR